jgi:hypothetical protein
MGTLDGSSMSLMEALRRCKTGISFTKLHSDRLDFTQARFFEICLLRYRRERNGHAVLPCPFLELPISLLTNRREAALLLLLHFQVSGDLTNTFHLLCGLLRLLDLLLVLDEAT